MSGESLPGGDGGSPAYGPGPVYGELPTDRTVDRRDFLQRVAALSVGVSAGTLGLSAPLPAVEPSPGALEEGGRSGGHFPRVKAFRAPSPFFSPVLLPDPATIEATEVWQLSLAEAASLIREGELSPVELVEEHLARIDRLDAHYMAFNMVLHERALEEARELERWSWRGPLHGVSLAVKDNFYTAGLLTTANSHIFEDFVPDFDATAVRRLTGAGGVIVGKTQMGPLATSRATTPDGEWTTLNAWAPHAPDVSPGGSSTGSAAAVAARMAASSIGTQTGGSINNPSLAQGLTGLKPTMGRASVYGVIPLTYTRDHPGPLARDAWDAALILQALAGPDESDPRTLGLPPPADYVRAAVPVERNGNPALRWPTTIGVLPGYLDDPEDDEEEDEGTRGRRRAELEARRQMLQTFEEMGAHLVEVDLPEDWDVLSGRTFNNVRLPERSEPFLEVLREDVRKFGVSLAPWINGLLLDGVEYARGQRSKLLLLERVLDDLFGHCDVVVQTDAYRFDILGLPLINFPIGFEEESTGHPRPLGAMFGGKPFAEDRLLSLAGAYQAITDWHRRIPADPTELSRSSRGGRPRLGRNEGKGRTDLREVMEVGE